MKIYCNSCFSEQQFDGNIPNEGIRQKCTNCRYECTLYPSGVMIDNFHDYLFYNHRKDLSGKAHYILRQNISSVDEFLKLGWYDFLRFRNCGLIISRELLEFKKRLQERLGLKVPSQKEDKDRRGGSTQNKSAPIPDFLKNNRDFFEVITTKLTVKTHDLLFGKIQIDSLEKFLALKREYLLSIKNCGWKTYNEILKLQRIVFQVLRELEHQKDSRIDDFKSMITLNVKIRQLLNIGDDIDPNKPFPSLDKWLLSVSSNSERNKDVFMLRMGMLGKPYQTYDQIGIKHDISRERVRSITEKMKKVGLLPHNRVRLDPLIERATKIVLSKGGEMSCSELIGHLLCIDPMGDLLKNAIPFIEYLNSFPLWQKAGLKITNELIAIKTKRTLMSEDQQVYYSIEIKANSPDMEIWLGDDKGHFVQKDKGTLNSSLMPGNYTVEFGLGTKCYPISLLKDTIFSQTDLEAGPSCKHPKVKIDNDQ